MLKHATPKISVLVFKTIDRSMNAEFGVPSSSRFAGKSPHIDLTPYLGDGSSVRTTKSTREAAGGFSITIPDHPHIDTVSSGGSELESIDTIYGLIEPVDVVEIRMWGGLKPLPPDKDFPIIMRGFVSSIQRSQSMGEDGKPQRSVVISGQDYGKIWQIIQILYLPYYADGGALLTSFSLSEMFGLQVVNAMPAHEFIKTAIEKIVNPFLQGVIWDGFANVKREVKTDNVLPTGGSVNISTSTQQGPIIDFLRSHGDVGHWNELYMLDAEDGVYCMYRPNPARRLRDHSLIIDGAPNLIYTNVPIEWVTNITITRSDADVYNYFWVDNSRFDLVTDMSRKQFAAQEGSISIADYPNAAKQYYGLRPLYASTQQAADDVKNWSGGVPESEKNRRDEQVSSWLDLRRKQLMDLNRDNVVFEKGVAKIKGVDRTIIPGSYVRFGEGGIKWYAYVYQIDHEFMPFQGYTTTLYFERGENFAQRIKAEDGKKSPWLSEQLPSDDELGSRYWQF